MRYLVTGATTMLGRAVTRRLVDGGHEVITVARKPDRARDELDRGVEVLHGDPIWKNSMYEALEGVHGVFHIGSYHHFKTKDGSHAQGNGIKLKRNVKEVMKEMREEIQEAKKKGVSVAERINIEGTRNIFELVKECKIPRVVYTSTMSVYSDTRGKMMHETSRYRGPWNSEYEHTMWRALYEVALPMAEKGLPIVVLQPGLLYGPGDSGYAHHLIGNCMRRGLRSPQDHKLRSYPAKTAFCWSYIDDVADAHIAAMKKGAIANNYLLTGPAHSVANVLEQIHKITGVQLPRRRISPFALNCVAAIMRLAGVFYPLDEYYSYEALRSIAGTTSLGSNEKAKSDLGFSPRSLHEGLRSTLYYEMSQLGLIEHEQSDDDVKILELEPEMF